MSLFLKRIKIITRKSFQKNLNTLKKKNVIGYIADNLF